MSFLTKYATILSVLSLTINVFQISLFKLIKVYWGGDSMWILTSYLIYSNLHKAEVVGIKGGFTSII